MFSLPYSFAVPDILFYEELEESHEELLSFGLKVLCMSSETIKYVESVVSLYPQASRNDLFALALARQEACPLVTGDRALRSAGEKEAVIIFGTIWIVDELIKYKIITKVQAKEAFELMRENKRRLPWELVKKRYE
jgi:predicted nucleic acid-binding protein